MPYTAWLEALPERLHFLQEAEAGLKGPEQLTWLKRLDAEHSALQKLARQAVAAEKLEAALEITTALAPYWLKRGELELGQRWLTWVLAIPACAQWPYLRSKALISLGEVLEQQADFWAAEQCLHFALQWAQANQAHTLAAQALALLALISFRHGLFPQSQTQAQQAIQHAEWAQDAASKALALRRLGLAYGPAGQTAEAVQCYQASLQLYKNLGDLEGQALTLNNLGIVAKTSGAPAEAQRLYEQALALFRQLETPMLTALTLGNLGRVALVNQQPELARDYATEAVLLAREIGARDMLVLELAYLGLALRACGEAGYAQFRESLIEAQETGKLMSSPVALYGIAEMLAQNGQRPAAVQMLSLLLQHATLSTLIKPDVEQLLAHQRAILPAAEFEAALTRGQQLSLAGVINHILELPPYEFPTLPA